MRPFHICLLALALIFSAPAYADHDTYVTIYPNINNALTVPDYAQATSIVRKTAGNISVIPAKKFEESHVVSFKDILASTPGVEAQPRYGEEIRLSIRGSGLSRSFHLRGITILQDGVPINLADGSGDFLEIDPLLTQYAEVYRGGNALRFGTATLGGAINVVSPNGESNPGTTLRMEGGSNGTFRFHAANGQKFKNGDTFIATTRSVSQGYRDQTDENKFRLTTNIGYRPTDSAETRFYLTYNDLDQEVPSTLSLTDAVNNPRAAAPVNLTNRYQRNVRSVRVSNKTAFNLGGDRKLTVGIFANDKTLYHPIFQVIDQKSIDTGAFTRYETAATTIGLNATRGHTAARQFINNGGIRGAQTADANQNASNLELYGEHRFRLSDPLTLIAGAQGFIAHRSLDNNANPAASADKTYYAINPKLGLLYEAAPGMQLFTNLSHSAEPPTFSELVQAPVIGFVPVDKQQAWTAEIGTRLHHKGLSIEVTAYHSRLTDEMLNFTTAPGIPAATFNAGRTIHQGIELGIGARLAPRVQGNLTYTYNDFHFDGDARFGNNALAGAPPHNFHLSARYDHPDGWFVEPSLEYVPQGGYVDYANSLHSSDFAVLNTTAGMELRPGVKIFLDGRNLFDKKYAATYNTITNANTVNNNVFFPGEARGFYAGLSVKF